jgi:hypothetical protein
LVPDSAELCEQLNKALPLRVDFNGDTPVGLHTYDRHQEIGVALRVLRSFLLTQVPESCTPSLHELQRRLLAGQGLSLEQALKLVLRRLPPGRTNVLLLVDETLKHSAVVADTCYRRELVYKLCGLMEVIREGRYLLAMATPDATVYTDYVIFERRPLAWAPLPLLTSDEAERLIAIAVRKAVGPGVDWAANPDLPLAIHVLVNDCGGHPRTLQLLLEHVLETLTARPPSATSLPLPQAAELVMSARHHVGTRLTSPAPTAWAIEAALGHWHDMKRPVPGDQVPGRTLAGCIADGVFINASATDADATPKLSAMQLLHADDSVAAHVKATIAKLLQVDVAALAARRSDASHRPILGGAPFERLVANLLLLKLQLAHLRDRTVTAGSPTGTGIELQRLFGYLTRWHANLTRRVTLSGVEAVVELDDLPASAMEMFPTAVGRAANALARDGVYTFKGNNAAFDVLVLLRDAAEPTRRVGIAVETKFSAPGQGHWTRGELAKKRDQLALYKPLWANLGMEPPVHVFLTARPLIAPRSEGARPPAVVPDSVRALEGSEASAGNLLLDRVATLRALTPTLAERATMLLRPDFRVSDAWTMPLEVTGEGGSS